MSSTFDLNAVTKALGGAENVRYEIDGSTLVLYIDLDTRLRPSASGKNTIVATTHGGEKVPSTPGIIVSINAYVRQ